MSRLARFSWGVLAYNVMVIAWGAFVRATGSGAGCGKHWPMCNGEMIPRSPRIETLVELGHRVTSGLSVALVVLLVIATYRGTMKGHPARKTAWWSLGFVMGEAAIGAGLVLFELVAHDQSAKRALSMSLHLCNTFFLLGALTLTAHYAGGGRRLRWRDQGIVRGPLLIAVLCMFVLGASGALVALGDTLFPAKSLADGIREELSPGAHFLLRLRTLHPFFALFSGVIVTAAGALARFMRPDDARVRTLSRSLTAMFMVQLCVGFLNLRLLVPVWTQILHLVCADVTFILLVLSCVETLKDKEGEVRAIFERDEARGLVHQR